MKLSRFASAVLLGASSFTLALNAQTARPRGAAPTGARPAQAKPAQQPPAQQPAQQQKAAPAPATATPPAGALAVVNGQTITLADIPDANLRTAVTGIDNDLKEMRKQALDDMIGRVLLDNEAKKVGVTVDQLIEQQIRSKAPAPTEDEITQFYNANKDQMNGQPLKDVRPQITDYLRNQKTQQLGSEYVARLRAANPVTMGPDVNSPGLAPATALATVNGQKITAGELEERLKPFVYQLRMKVFEAEKNAVDAKINDILLAAEAKKRNVSPDDLIRADVTSKVTAPTDAEITKFYNDNKDRIQGDLPTLKPQIADFLQAQQASKLEYELAQRLRTGASIQTYLIPPEPPVQNISTDGGATKGNQAAPVTIVVFTDFQCPHCAATHPVLEKLQQSYGDKVRLVVRDFPLVQHADARKAAEAASAANAQGKFFEYADVLFKNQSALDVPSLKKYATEVGLDRAKFDAALDGGNYAGQVSKDIADGQFYAVDSTPAIFVNGVRVADVSEIGIRAAVDKALAKAGK
jgi:protein-disulfide isomerase